MSEEIKNAVEKFIESLPKITTTKCNYCGKYHEEKKLEYGDLLFVCCPNHPLEPMVTVLPLNI